MTFNGINSSFIYIILQTREFSNNWRILATDVVADGNVWNAASELLFQFGRDNTLLQLRNKAESDEPLVQQRNIFKVNSFNLLPGDWQLFASGHLNAHSLDYSTLLGCSRTCVWVAAHW